MPPTDRSSPSPTRKAALRAVVDEVVQRRTAGESIRDEDVYALHPHLMPDLVRQLELLARLTQAHADSHELGEQTVTMEVVRQSPTPLVEIAGYQIIKEIFRGGQGVVYEAVQQSTGRRVAIKALHEGRRLRFAREVRILAQLHHPNIVNIHDSGAAEDGRNGPFQYLIMDFVDGRMLNHYCDQRRNAWKSDLRGYLTEIIQLFAQIAEAVNAAHIRGVIHRDLKPSNILVTEDRVPKILDFGLAKLTSGSDLDLSVTTDATRAGHFFGSLPWASPEQADGRMSDVDTRSDVYSLGVLIFQMATGVFPYDLSGGTRAALSNIVLQDPRRPSTLLREQLSKAVALETVQTAKPMLPPAGLLSDLDAIVLKCLRKPVEQRYQSAAELARDLRRCLVGEPIAARSDSTVYVLSRLLRRYRGRVTLAGLALLGLLVFSGGMSVLAERNRRLATSASAARMDAVAARDDAKRRLDDALAARAEAEWRTYVADIQAAQAAIAACDTGAALHRLTDAPQQYRNWEWRYLASCADQSVYTLQAHPGWVSSVEFSPDGAAFVTTGADGTARLFDAATRRMNLEFNGHTDYVFMAAFRPDGAQIATVSRDGSTLIWDCITGQTIHSFPRQSDAVCDVAFSPDGDRLATACQNGQVRIWSLKSGAELLTFGQNPTPGLRLAFTPDGQSIATTTESNDALLWNASSGEILRRFSGHTDSISSLAVAADGSTLATGSFDGAIRLWDLATGAARLVLRGHNGRVIRVRFDCDGQRLVSSSFDNTVRVWDARTGAELATLLGHRQRVTCAAFGPDGNSIVSSAIDGTVKFWDLHSQRFVISDDRGVKVQCLEFSPSGAQLALGCNDSTIRLWQVAEQKQSAQFVGHCRSVNAIAFSPDGERLASGSDDQTVCIWEVSRGQALTLLPGLASPVSSVAFSPNGRDVAAAAADGRIAIWPGCDPAHPLEIAGHSLPITTLVYSPDGTQLATGSADQRIRIWDARDGRMLIELRGHSSGVNCVRFSHDNVRIASSSDDESIILWDVASGQALRTLRGHARGVRSIAFSHDDSRLASGSLDGTVRLWDVASGENVISLRDAFPFVRSVAFRSDDAYLAAAASDGRLRLFAAPPLKPSQPAPPPPTTSDPLAAFSDSPAPEEDLRASRP